MSTAAKSDLVSEDDYLAGELVAEQKHEYLSGVVYAMAGENNRHNDIVGNVFGELRNRLKGKTCQPCNSDTKVRIRLITGTRYYYPDAMVVCEPNPPNDSYQDRPALVVEVFLQSTRRSDEWEKRDAYLSIASLNTLLLVEHDSPRVAVMRRTSYGFEREDLTGIDAVVSLPDIDADLPLREIYSRVQFD